MKVNKGLRGLGLRVTKARAGVMRVLEEKDRPMDVGEIFSGLKSRGVRVDRVTVYRVLERLVEKGVIGQVDFREGKLRYELKNEHHHHLVCKDCGSVEAVYGDKLGEVEKQIQRQYQFVVKEHALEFFGRCKNCHE